MLNEDNVFNINTILNKVFSNLKDISDEKKVELIFEMNATVPKELRGNDDLLADFLTEFLNLIIENTQDNEVVLSLNAPEDFLYEDDISFEIKHSRNIREKVTLFLEKTFAPKLSLLEGKIVKDNTENVKINIPFKLHELGFRRHYRLPDKSMLDKKVMIICESENLIQ